MRLSKKIDIIYTMNLDQALKTFVTNDKTTTTHTKIGNPEIGIFGNKYSINSENEKKFYETYQSLVLKKKQEAYLTEKQLEIGKIAIDLDFRYSPSVQSKQHTNEHINDFVEMITNLLYNIFDNTEDKPFNVYILEKQNVNQCDDKTKDGIHIILNIICDFATKMIIRDHIIKELPDIWDDLPFTNSWGDIVDEGVMRGSVNWQLYGSKKPGCEPYQLKTIYCVKISNDGEIEMNQYDPSKKPFHFPSLCIRNISNCHKLMLKDEYKEEYSKKKSEFSFKKIGKSLKRKKKSQCSSLQDAKSFDELKMIVDELMEDENIDYNTKEIYQYTMVLPKEFWGQGSYNKWIRVGWALKNSGEQMAPVWYLFSSQSPEFDFVHNDVLEYWNDFDVFNKEGLTYRSILYWAKVYSFDEYQKIYKTTIDHYIYYSFRNNTECDLATALFHMYKSQYVCSSITENTWYEFLNHKWYSIDSGSTLRLRISTEMYKQYSAKLLHYQTTNQASQNNIALTQNASSPQNANTIISEYKNNDDDFGDYKKKVNQMLETCKLLKKTAIKNNIMREAKELYYDKEFLNKLDKDPYLLGCNNCIIDFREKSHRKGKHDDYISKSTGLNYYPLKHYQEKHPNLIEEIDNFMKQLFPDTIIYNDNSRRQEVKRESLLREYMWEHLASTLLGTIENQTFNIYTGSGANGKSKLVELMSLVLGEYKSTVPISLITQKRNNIGGTSSEVYNLMGTRYAVMQEPSKGDKINEGIMKELTGGDPIQCRALFKNSVTFIPQFKLAVCTNELFDVVSNDDGTWRRLRKVDFKSKFTENPYNDPKFPEKEYPHQFKVDTKIDEKFKKWAPVLLSILVDIAYKTQGKVKDVKPVISATEEYRQEQDVMLEFHNEYFVATPNPSGYTVKDRDMFKKFTNWWDSVYNNSNRKKPSQKEVRAYFVKRYGNIPKGGWTNFSYKDDFSSAKEENAMT